MIGVISNRGKGQNDLLRDKSLILGGGCSKIKLKYIGKNGTLWLTKNIYNTLVSNSFWYSTWDFK